DDPGETHCFRFGLADVHWERLDHVARRVLLVGDDIGGGVDGAARYGFGLQDPQRLVAGVPDGPCADRSVEPVAVTPASGIVLQFRVGGQVGTFDDPHIALEYGVAVTTDD